MNFDPIESCILLGYRGSIAHNLYLPPDEPMGTDDVDTMGVCIAPLDCYFGLEKFEQVEIKPTQDDNTDQVIYDLRKFVRLLTNSNPNVLSFLWNKHDMYTKITGLGAVLLANRNLFATKAAYKAFAGYASAQLRKMDKGAPQGYMGSKRKRIVEEYGYDTKNASHCIRLLKMCIEFMATGEFNVWRAHDRDELLGIKQGKWTLEEIRAYAEDLFSQAKIARDNSTLPDVVDRDAVNDLLVRIYKEHFRIGQIQTIGPWCGPPVLGADKYKRYACGTTPEEFNKLYLNQVPEDPDSDD